LNGPGAVHTVLSWESVGDYGSPPGGSLSHTHTSSPSLTHTLAPGSVWTRRRRSPPLPLRLSLPLPLPPSLPHTRSHDHSISPHHNPVSQHYNTIRQHFDKISQQYNTISQHYNTIGAGQCVDARAPRYALFGSDLIDITEGVCRCALPSVSVFEGNERLPRGGPRLSNLCERLTTWLPLSSEHGTYKTVKARLWPWEGYRENRRCSRDTYPESCITKYTTYTKIKSP